MEPPRPAITAAAPECSAGGPPLTTLAVERQLQAHLGPEFTLVAETGGGQQGVLFACALFVRTRFVGVCAQGRQMESGCTWVQSSADAAADASVAPPPGPWIP